MLDIAAQSNGGTCSADAVGTLDIHHDTGRCHGVQIGNLSINHFVASIAETPFGGLKDSGHAREGGSEGLPHYT